MTMNLTAKAHEDYNVITGSCDITTDELIRRIDEFDETGEMCGMIGELRDAKWFVMSNFAHIFINNYEVRHTYPEVGEAEYIVDMPNVDWEVIYAHCSAKADEYWEMTHQEEEYSTTTLKTIIIDGKCNIGTQELIDRLDAYFDFYGYDDIENYDFDDSFSSYCFINDEYHYMFKDNEKFATLWDKYYKKHLKDDSITVECQIAFPNVNWCRIKNYLRGVAEEHKKEEVD